MDDAPAGGLSGEWIGHYVNEEDFREDGGHEFGISVRFVQEGETLTGTMVDLNPANVVPAHWWTAVPSAVQWSKIDRIGFEIFLRQHPDAVIQNTTPERARVVGEVRSGCVRFDKRYIGLGWSVTYSRGKEIGKRLVGENPVEYSGLLSEDEQEIVGIWTLWPQGRRDVALGRGEFRLTRKTDLV